MLQELWQGVSLDNYNKWHPLTGEIARTPEKYLDTWTDVNKWFETFALRAQNDINAYLNFILYKFPFDSYKDEKIKETLIDMVFVCIEHWVYNRTPIEFNADASMVFNNGQTQLNSFSLPTINIWDLAPSRMKILANLTQLKDLFDSYQDEAIDLSLIDLNEFYTRTQVNELLQDKQNEIDNINISLNNKADKSEIPDISNLETKEEHTADINKLENEKADKSEIPDISNLTTKQELADGLKDKQKNITLLPNESGRNNADFNQETGELRIWDPSFDGGKQVADYSIIDSSVAGIESTDDTFGTTKYQDKFYLQKTDANTIYVTKTELNNELDKKQTIVFETLTQTDILRLLDNFTYLSLGTDAGARNLIGIADPLNPEDASNKRYVDELLSKKQDLLYDSGDNQNVKTINNESIFGKGNIQITSPVSWIEGEYKWMPDVTEMPTGWKKVETQPNTSLVNNFSAATGLVIKGGSTKDEIRVVNLGTTNRFDFKQDIDDENKVAITSFMSSVLWQYDPSNQFSDLENVVYVGEESWKNFEATRTQHEATEKFDYELEKKILAQEDEDFKEYKDKD